MATFFVSRHPGALAWARRQGIVFDHYEPHLDLERVGAGDTVIGSLPINLAAMVCAQGALYKHLALTLKLEDRGRELSADELDGYEAHLVTYQVTRLD